MVLLSASICTKNGRVVVARQFKEVSRSRIEGLLAAFPKLIKGEEQHTFVETDSVRYVYQPMESLFLVLITTKNSNILEDLETLRLFARVVPEYCRNFSENEVRDNAFELIFAFDEVIALGYRENVNLSQIRLYTLMESHEEQLQLMIRKNKEQAARAEGLRREKELKKLRQQEALTARFAGGGGGGSRGGFGGDTRYSGSGGSLSGPSSSNSGPAPSASTSTSSSYSSRPASVPKKERKGGMKLGSKAKTNDFVEALIAEGEVVQSTDAPIVQAQTSNTSLNVPEVARESVHVRIEERINLIATRDGGMEEMNVKGVMQLNVSDSGTARVTIATAINEDKGLSFTTHPNISKDLWRNNFVLANKKADRPFPINTDVGVLKWRFSSNDEGDMPLAINCWPNPNSDGSCDVNVDFELLDKSLTLEGVSIAIPLPSGTGNPIVSTVTGDYEFNSRDSLMLWSLPVIDANESEGSFEFSVPSNSADDFFPVIVSFASSKSYGGLEITGVTSLEDDSQVPFSTEVLFSADQYEIV